MARSLVVLVRQAGLGHVDSRDARFGIEMLDRFLHVLESHAAGVTAICFYTEGVTLVCEGSPVISGLQLLKDMGVRLAVCSSCLTHYGLREKLAVGAAVGVADIVDLITTAERVVTV